MQSTKFGSFSSKIGSLVALSVLALPLALVQPASAQNLVVNGGFEAPALGFGTWGVFSAIPGWISNYGPGIEVQNHAAGSPFEGQQHVELDSHFAVNTNSGMFQNIPTQAGKQYLLSFRYSPRPGVGLESNKIFVLWDGSFFTTLALDGTGLSDTHWHLYQYTVIGNPGFTTLAFGAIGPDDSLGGYLDDVSVTAVAPEPTSMALLGSGALGLIAKLRRRQQDQEVA
jgi:hypothetical protein